MSYNLPRVTIYTDGACSENPGPGGWGVVILDEYGNNEQLWGSNESTTSNRMELLAALKALQHLKSSHIVNLYTDSMYLKNGITDWIYTWKCNGWKTANNSGVKNIALWRALSGEIDNHHQVQFHWVKAHDGNKWNELADNLARRGRNQAFREVYDEDY